MRKYQNDKINQQKLTVLCSYLYFTTLKDYKMLFEYISKFNYSTKNMNYNSVLFDYMLIFERIFIML